MPQSPRFSDLKRYFLLKSHPVCASINRNPPCGFARKPFFSCRIWKAHRLPRRESMSQQPRITVVCGHYGCGKTNLTLNLALEAAAAGERVTVADLDIVNPYFRSSEYGGLLEEQGVRLIAPVFAGTTLDTPTLPPELYSIFEPQAGRGVHRRRRGRRGRHRVGRPPQPAGGDGLPDALRHQPVPGAVPDAGGGRGAPTGD